MQKNKINNKGFSLLEASIVMGVVSIGVLGVFSLVLQNIQAQKVSKNILVASMLAQEGLELARNIRDDNWIANPVVDWDSYIKGWADDDFSVDYTMTFKDANGIGDAKAELYKDSANNFYTHTTTGGNTKTMYSRLIDVTGVDASDPFDGIIDYYKVKSHVQWRDGDVLKDYIAETYLYNWR
ncbi:prepilin-type N-terminal cleavage/methylation domain-containing protein [Candidatus Parcubacteria bacterium]|nr:prepilin-type N-terminal cleavage/methylation domain-containing protein [Candidatus Parcubacteria bacterium]